MTSPRTVRFPALGRLPALGRFPALGRAPEILALSSVGVLLVAVGYAGGRIGRPGAEVWYWVGQLVVLVPVAARVLSNRLAGAAEAFLLVIGLAANQYLLKWMYNPDQFQFPDELQHWAGTTVLVATGTLFQPNPSLPPAVHFPGLEEMGAAVVSLSGLPVTAAGMLVAAVAHLTFVGALFMVVRSVGGSPAVAALTCVIYATGLHYLFFDSMYIYQTAALPFLMLAVWASRRWRWRERATLPFAVVGVVALMVAAVSHHVTSAAMVATLALLAVCELVVHRRHEPRSAQAGGTLVLAGIAATLVPVWLAFVARDVLGYLSAPVAALTASAVRLFTEQSSSGTPAPDVSPPWATVIQSLGVLALLVIFLRAAYATIRARRSTPAWRWALVVGSLCYFVTPVMLFFGAQGPELAGRTATFAYLPVSMLTATEVLGWHAGRARLPTTARPSRRRRLTSPLAGGLALIVLLTVGARVIGWPPLRAQLPGSFLVSGFERSVEPQGVAAAWFAHDQLGPGHRFAADLGGLTLVTTYGGQAPVDEAAPLYFGDDWDSRHQRTLEESGVDYLWVDLRLSEQVPVYGSYFTQDPQEGRYEDPLPASALTKFDELPGIDRIYDSGDIRIYAMAGV